MLHMIFAFIATCLTACNSQAKPEQPQPAPKTTAAAPAAPAARSAPIVTTSGKPVRAVVLAKGDDDVQSLSTLAELDDTISTAVAEAMRANTMAQDAYKDAMAQASRAYTLLGQTNPSVWRYRQVGVEYDENAAFLGVSTEPVNPQTAAQLPITAGTGLVLTTIEAGSPAATGGLQQMDVLAKLDDQMLVNAEQLAVLLRAHKPGDKVKLTVLRGGKEVVANVALGSRKLPKLGPGGARADGGFDIGNEIFVVPDGGTAGGGLWTRAPKGAQGVPLVRTRAMAPSAAKGAASTPVEASNMALTYTSDAATIEYRSEDGEVHVTVKDLEGGTTIFDEDREPTKEEIEAMRPEIRKEVERVLKEIKPGTAARPGVLFVPRAPTPPVPPAVPTPKPPPQTSTQNVAWAGLGRTG